MYSAIDVFANAKLDIRSLRTDAPGAFAAIVFWLEQARAEPQFVQKLNEHGDNVVGSVPCNIIGWVAARAAGHHLMRVKFPPESAAAGYRIICGYDWKGAHVGLLAAVARERLHEYELTTEIGRRIISDWNIATDGRRTY